MAVPAQTGAAAHGGAAEAAVAQAAAKACPTTTTTTAAAADAGYHTVAVFCAPRGSFIVVVLVGNANIGNARYVAAAAAGGGTTARHCRRCGGPNDSAA
jgi:hypothetical protein